MNFGIKAFLDKSQNPIYYIIFKIDFNNTIFYTTFLQNRKAESLSNTSIILFLQNLNS